MPQKSKKSMWEHQLTLQDIRLHANRIPQKRIQDENERYGLARCANETKDKSVRKLTEFLMKTPNPEYVKSSFVVPNTTTSNNVVEVQLDDNIIIQVKLSENKTKQDLIAYICKFETQN